METSERIRSGVTVIGAETPSAYHMAPRSSDDHTTCDSRDQFPVSSTALVDASGEAFGKKKRGRPRKYGADGTPVQISAVPISSSAPSVKKRGRGRLSGLDFKMNKRMGFHTSDEFVGTIGSHFTPHIITVSAGEDVTMRIISFCQQGPRAICILSANGVISNVTLRQPDSSGGTLTYEGRFELLSLSGSFMPTEKQGTTTGRSGGMSVSLASPNGRVVGGGVAGLLIAASPVQVVVGTFVLRGEQEEDHKARKQKVDDAPWAVVSSSNPDKDLLPPQGQTPSSFDISSWTNGHESRNSGTDINISLPAA